MAAPRKYDDKTRREIHRLVNLENKRSPEAARIIASGLADVPAQQIPEGTVKLIAQQERSDIQTLPKTEQLRELTGLAVKVIHDGFSRQQAKSTEADADDTLKLVRSLRELEPLLTDRPTEKGEAKPNSVAGKLAVAPEPQEHTNTQGSSTSPVSARAAS